MTSPDAPDPEAAIPAEPTDRQLTVLLRFFARTYLEVERGIRSPTQLRTYCTPGCYRQLRAAHQPRHTREGPVLPGDLGTIDLTRTGDTVHADIPTRITDDRRAAITVTATIDDRGQLTLTHLQRVHGHHLRHRTEVDRDGNPEEEPHPDRRLLEALKERNLAAAAAREAAALADDADLPADRRAHHGDAHDHWRRQARSLDTEIAQLRRHRQLRDLAELPQADDPAVQTAARLLGPMPRDPELRNRYSDLVADITAYRDRWDITDPTVLLGPTAAADPQQHQRSELIGRIRALAIEISHERDPARDSHERARESTSPLLAR